MHNCSGGRTTNLKNSAKINVNNSIHLTRCKGGFMLHPAKPYFRPSHEDGSGDWNPRKRRMLPPKFRPKQLWMEPCNLAFKNNFCLLFLFGIFFTFRPCSDHLDYERSRAIFFFSESLSLFKEFKVGMHRNLKMCIFCFYFALFWLT